MSIHVIGDQNTVLGFRLVCGQGNVVTTAEDARKAFERAVDDDDVDLLFITYEWARTMEQRLNRLKMTRLKPLVMEIPSHTGETPDTSIRRLVSEAVGVKL